MAGFRVLRNHLSLVPQKSTWSCVVNKRHMDGSTKDETLHPIFTIEFYNGYYTLKMCCTAATSTSFAGAPWASRHPKSGELSSAFTWVLAPHRVLHTIESILLDTIALHIAEVNLLSFSGEGEFSQGSFKHSYLELHASLVQRRWTGWHADCCFIF